MFGYHDIMAELPDGPYRPTERQLIRELQHANYLVIVEDGKWRRETRYMLKIWKEAEDMDDEASALDMLNKLTIETPSLCSITMSFQNGGVVVDQSLDITIRGDRDNARIAFSFMFPEEVDKEGDIHLKVNRQALRNMSCVYDPSTGHIMWLDDGDYHVEMRANKDARDCGHLINAIRANGGIRYFDMSGRNEQ